MVEAVVSSHLEARPSLLLRLSEIWSRVSQLARQLLACEWMLPGYGHADDSARPHIECQDEITHTLCRAPFHDNPHLREPVHPIEPLP